MPRCQDPMIAKMDRKKMSLSIQELTGFSQRQADNAIGAVSIAMETWLHGIIRDIPYGTKARMCLKGLGTIEVRYQKPKQSRWRIENNLPQRPATIIVAFIPGRALELELRQANRPIRQRYLEVYHPAKERYLEQRRQWKREHPDGNARPSKEEQQISRVHRVHTIPADGPMPAGFIRIDDTIPEGQIEIQNTNGQQLATVINISTPPWDQMSQAVEEAEQLKAEDQAHQHSALTQLITKESAPHLTLAQRETLTKQLQALQAKKAKAPLTPADPHIAQPALTDMHISDDEPSAGFSNSTIT